MPTSPPHRPPIDDAPVGVGRLDLALLSFALAIYLITRVAGLTAYPIYFFCDEAIQANLAEGLLHNGLRAADGTFLPPYFENVDKWNLSLSVYVHLLTVALVGKSVLATRLTSVLVGALGAVAIALTLRLIFRARCWWAAVLVLAALPAWFLHSRTAFETVLMVAFYACFLCSYLLYRYRSPRYLIAALLFGAATFYSYANGQGVMLVTGVLLLLLDLPYHLRHRRLFAWCLPLVALLALPYVRFRLLHPEALEQHLRVLDSYWLHALPFGRKLLKFGQLYLYGLSPTYWFLPNETDLVRHRMLGMGHLPVLLLPLWLVGVAVCVRHWRSAAHRTVFVAMLASCFSAALAGIAVTRTLAMVVPATLLIGLGLDQVARWTQRWLPERVLGIAVALALATMSLTMLQTALAAGPTWFTNYALYGMQYGGPQVFAAVGEDLAASPELRAIVTPNWANNPQALAEFFLTPEQLPRVRFAGIGSYMRNRIAIDPPAVFVLLDDEYRAAQASGKFVIDAPLRVLPYPDGTPGFYFVRLRYVDNIDALLEADRASRGRLIIDTVELDGQTISVAHSPLDMGRLPDLFDQNPDTLIRGEDANPLVLELAFPRPRSIGGVRLTVASMDFQLTITATPADGGAPRVFERLYTGLPRDPQVDYRFAGGAISAGKLRLAITQIGRIDPVHVHVRELQFE